MIFIFGISNGRKDLNFHQTMVCSVCGRYGSYKIIMEYMFFSLFFIPIFKWNKTYYVKTGCCGTLYTIDRELGKRIARGENIDLQETDLHKVQSGWYHSMKRCSKCNFTTREDYKYCPNCANPMD